MNKMEYYRAALKNLGLISTINMEKEKRFGLDRPMRLTSRYLDYHVTARRGSSDLQVFAQIFTLREYRCLDGLNLDGLIVDLGANVGYAAAYFLSQFPRCRVVAVEPFAPNIEVMRSNLAPYGSRVATIEAAVMPGADLVTLASNTDPGEEWAVTVAASDQGNIPTITIPEILQRAGADRIALLKIDIEGAEKQLFEADTSWLDLVDNIVVELHGEEAERAFYAKINRTNFCTTRSDELTVCMRP